MNQGLLYYPPGPDRLSSLYLWPDRLTELLNTGWVQAPTTWAWAELQLGGLITASGVGQARAVLLRAQIDIEWIAALGGSDLRRAVTAKFASSNTEDPTLDVYRKVSASGKKDDSIYAGADT